MERLKKIIKYSIDDESLYQLKIEETLVNMQYSNSNRSFRDCMLNVLRIKKKNGGLFIQ